MFRNFTLYRIELLGEVMLATVALMIPAVCIALLLTA